MRGRELPGISRRSRPIPVIRTPSGETLGESRLASVVSPVVLADGSPQGRFKPIPSPGVGPEGDVPLGEFLDIQDGAVARLFKDNPQLQALPVAEEQDVKRRAANPIAVIVECGGCEFAVRGVRHRLLLLRHALPSPSDFPEKGRGLFIHDR